MSPPSATVALRAEEASRLEARACQLAGEVRELLQRAAELRAGARDGCAGDDDRHVDERQGEDGRPVRFRESEDSVGVGAAKAEAMCTHARSLTPPLAGHVDVSGEPAVLLKVPEAAKLASMTPGALRHVIQRGQLPRGVVVHRGRRVFIDRERFCSAIRRDRAGRV
jgi:hypothetical protein